MSFLSPYYLFALIGVAIPIAIHLWNRKQGKVIKVGSISLFAKSETHKINSLKLSEWRLLLLRILLIILIALIMSGLYTSVVDSKYGKLLILLDTEYVSRKEISHLLDTVDRVHVSVLQQGFPTVEDMKQPVVHRDYWSLIRQMQELPYDSIVIYTPLRLRNFSGKMGKVPHHVSFISLPEEEGPTSFIEKAYWSSGDSIDLILGENNDNQLTYTMLKAPYRPFETMRYTIDINPLDSTVWIKNTVTDTVKIKKKQHLNIGIHVSDTYTQDFKWIEAAFETLSAYNIATFEIAPYKENDVYDLVVWLSEEPANYAYQSGVWLLLDTTALPQPVIKWHDSFIYKVTNRVHPLFMKESDLLSLPEKLYAILIETALLDQYDSRLDLRSVRDQASRFPRIQSIATTGEHTADAVHSRSLHHWLWCAFFMLLLTERLVSIYKNAR